MSLGLTLTLSTAEDFIFLPLWHSRSISTILTNGLDTINGAITSIRSNAGIRALLTTGATSVDFYDFLVLVSHNSGRADGLRTKDGAI